MSDAREKTASRVTADLSAVPPKGSGAKGAIASDGAPELAGLGLGQQTLSEILTFSRTRVSNHSASCHLTLLSGDVST